MNLLILKYDPIGEPIKYRGTERPMPSYVSSEREEAHANMCFDWFVSESEQGTFAHDFVRAKELVDAYRELKPPQLFEIIEITNDDQPSSLNGEFLGFDLSNGYYSLLSWGLEVDRKPHSELAKDDPFWILLPLLSLLKAFFQPLLNLNGLFNQYQTAEFCLDCMIALQKIRPGLWENEGVTFKVIGLWRVFPVDGKELDGNE